MTAEASPERSANASSRLAADVDERQRPIHHLADRPLDDRRVAIRPIEQALLGDRADDALDRVAFRLLRHRQLADAVFLEHRDRVADPLGRPGEDERGQSAARGGGRGAGRRCGRPRRSWRAARSRASTRRCRPSTGSSDRCRAGSRRRRRRRRRAVGVRSRATSSAATIAVPHEPPDRMPSSRVSRRAIANASRSLTRTQRSTTLGSYVPGKKSSPDPLGQVRPGGVARQDAALGVGADHLDRAGCCAFRACADSRDRAAGPDARRRSG